MSQRPFEMDPADAVVVEEPKRNPLPAEPEPAPRSRLRIDWWWFWGGTAAVTLALLVANAIASTAQWIAEQPLFGYPLATVLAVTLAAGLFMLLREVVAVRRLGRLGHRRVEAERLLASDLHGQSDGLIDPVLARVADRPELGRTFHEQDDDAFSDGERLKLFERSVVVGMDEVAYRAVVRGSRDIGVLTAISPLGLLDAALVLWRTMAMLRGVAGAYGLPLGAVASAMLLRRAVRNVLLAGLTDLVTHGAANAVSGGFLGLVSAKAGQGATNAMLAARLGCEAMNVVRPLPFTVGKRPNLKLLARRILAPGEKPPPAVVDP
ncbi:MAG: TIGR01620 family protein [Pseudomonadota bacterium]